MNLLRQLLFRIGLHGRSRLGSDQSLPDSEITNSTSTPISEADAIRAARNYRPQQLVHCDKASYHAALGKLATAQGERCLWCGSNNSRRIQADVARYGDRSYDVWHCFDCDVRFSPCARGPSVDYDAISRRHAWYKLLLNDTQTVDQILANGPERFWAYMACAYLNRIPWCGSRRFREILHRMTTAAVDCRKLEIIEVGCAMGLMGAVAGHLGHSYCGVDIQCASLDLAKSRFEKYGAVFDTVSEDWFQQMTSSRQYDLVFSSEVIEHTPDPCKFLEKLLSLAKPGGEVIFTTPDLDHCIDRVWATDLPPIHTVFLHKKAVADTLNRLCPSAQHDIYNEDLGIDWVWVNERMTSTQIEEIKLNPSGKQVDPTRADFYYDVNNVGFTSVISEPRFVLDPIVRERTLRAALNDVRVLGASMIGIIKL